MVEAVGLQQVLQLSSMASRAQMAQQGQGAELARSFDKDLQKLADREGDKAHEVEPTPEEVKTKEEGSGGRKARAFIRQPGAAPDEESKDEPDLLSESGQGNIINVVA